MSIWKRLVKINNALSSFFSYLTWYAILVVVVVELYAINNGYLITPFFTDCCGSMYPTMKVNHLCVAGVESVSRSEIVARFDGTKISTNYFPNEDDIKIGDIVSWKYRTVHTIVHRVVDYCPEYVAPPMGVVTKGDNVNKSDYVCIPWWAIQNKVRWVKCL